MTALQYTLNKTGIKQNDVAQILGIKPQNVNMWCQGKKLIPEKYLTTLAEITHVDQELLRLSDLNETIVAKIERELLINRKAPADEVAMMDARISEFSALDTIRFYMEKANVTPFDENGVIQPQTPEQKAEAIKRNVDRVMKMFDLLDILSDETIDTLVKTLKLVGDDYVDDKEKDRQRMERR